jgi:hypothetical protein
LVGKSGPGVQGLQVQRLASNAAPPPGGFIFRISGLATQKAESTTHRMQTKSEAFVTFRPHPLRAPDATAPRGTGHSGGIFSKNIKLFQRFPRLLH